MGVTFLLPPGIKGINMALSRFNALAILHGNKSSTEELNLINVANDFLSKFESREKHFLTFK